MGRNIRSVKDFVSVNYPHLDYSMSPLSREIEDNLIEDHPYLEIRRISQSYRRYGYALCDFVARKLLFEWLSDYGKTKLFKKLGVKIVNSGMAAINLAIHTVNQHSKKDFIVPSDLYFASKELFSLYEKKLIGKVYFLKKGEILNKSNHRQNSVVFLEKCGNSPEMIFWSEEEIIKLTNFYRYVILDGSLIGLSRINPSILEQRNLLYVESLSKNYHLKESSNFSAGILIYNRDLEELINKEIFCLGNYLQINDLLQFPNKLYMVGKERIRRITNNVRNFYIKVRKLLMKSRIKISKIGLKYKEIPMVIFIDFKEKNKAKQFIYESKLKIRGSFGHNNTYILPIGLMWNTTPPGLIRIAFGVKSNNNKIIKAIKKAI